MKNIDEKACEIVEELKADFDLSTIAYKLVSFISDIEKVKGKDKIGKSLKDIQTMLSRTREGGGGSRNRSRNRSQRRRNGSQGQNQNQNQNQNRDGNRGRPNTRKRRR
jgi:ATP-dependent RNA helicase DeaD